MQNSDPVTAYYIDLDYGSLPFWEEGTNKNVPAESIEGLSLATVMLAYHAEQAWRDIQYKILDHVMESDTPLPKALREKRDNVYRMLLSLVQFARNDRPDIRFTLRMEK